MKTMYEYVVMSPEGWRVGSGWTDSIEEARHKCRILLEDYPPCSCRIYRYPAPDADPVLAEVVR